MYWPSVTFESPSQPVTRHHQSLLCETVMFQTAYLPFTAPCSCLSCYCCSVTKSCLAPCNPIDCSTPGSISSSNEYSGLISFRMDWLDLLAVRETLKSLLQHHNLKTSILQCSAFFMVQLSHPYMTTPFNHILHIFFLFMLLIWNFSQPEEKCIYFVVKTLGQIGLLVLVANR